MTYYEWIVTVQLALSVALLWATHALHKDWMEMAAFHDRMIALLEKRLQASDGGAHGE